MGSDNILWNYSLPKLNQEERGKANELITRNESEYVIKKLPTNKSPRPDGFIGEFYQTFKEELILHKLSQKVEEEVKAQEKTEEVKAPVEKKTAKKTSSKSKKAESEVE